MKAIRMVTTKQINPHKAQILANISLRIFMEIKFKQPNQPRLFHSLLKNYLSY